MTLRLPARFWTESEAGWGTRPDGYTVHRDEETAAKNVAGYWAKEKERNPSGRVPAEYTRPSETSAMVEVSQALYDEVMEKGTVWAHYTSHLEQHAKSWSKSEAR
jgi:hypothetical protein